MPRSVYIHIPFCTNKCFYCDFNSHVTEDQQLIWDYLHALKQEMEHTVKKTPVHNLGTIFVGGGTPTFLSSKQMHYFLECVERYFPHQGLDVEFTMEANPGTTDLEKLQVMKQGGVNRLSYGVQAFDDQILKDIGRIHDTKQVLNSIKNAKKAGFSNISIDLIFGLPQQTVPIFNHTIDLAFSLDLQHFSTYALKVEEDTLFHVLYEKDQLALPPEDDEFEMYQIVRQRMEEEGFAQYEISNFAKPGFQSRHNKTYWENNEYYGIGAGAHGFVKQSRHENAGPVHQYINEVKEKNLPRIAEHQVEPKESMEDFMIMGLRILDGVSKREFSNRYKKDLMTLFQPTVNELINKGLLEETEEHLRLTKQGVLFGNEVFVRFLQ